ncbi:aldehyde dehydrogenase [Rhodococcus wratislaviensis]|uniref:Putative aldehyde dehydrogenase n=1 Tax=Rhodococcus wratislaviensis NBRC 100605 TaxID=1219028 RepID=X0R2B2_RHOWR|nr:aldehyde dehydrogenase [Rhodococcus wratislaviensis]GAF45000.1 putative aldehyde dehydrogenase [Rhodococcus wratislaviensis NBRC 100605]
MTIDYTDLYIRGAWARPSGDSTIPVISPTTEQRIGSVPEGTETDVDDAVDAARAALTDWASWTAAQRAEVLGRFADELESRAEDTAARVSSQNGMPITLARQFEGGFPPVLLRYYAEMAAKQEDEIRPGMLGGSTLVTRSPIGVVGAIVPWNVPQAITFLKLAPALAAGCTVVLKPSPETVLDAFLMAEAAIAAGLPPGVLNIVPGGRDLGAYLVAHPGIDKVSFTGSTGAGRAIGRTCGELLRPVTLELGGKSAAVILDDADLTANLESFYGATLLNNGQICWLGTRVLAPRSRYSEIVDTISDLAKGLTVGDPLSDTTQMGPLVSSRQRERVEGYIEKGRSDGGRVTAGGGRPADTTHGWFVEPTVFADVETGHTIAQEEIFGPVLSVIPYTDEAEAIAIANHSDYGLGGSIWTADPERGAQFARGVASGTVGINGYSNDPTAPFGGIKNSGLGRELGPEGLASYQQLKSIYLDVR